MANSSTIDPSVPPFSPGEAHHSPSLPTSSLGHEYPPELALVSLALLAVIAFMLVAIAILLVCCCMVLRKARREARRGAGSRVPTQVQFRRGNSNNIQVPLAAAPDVGAGPSHASLLHVGLNGTQFETADPTDPSLDQNNELYAAFHM